MNKVCSKAKLWSLLMSIMALLLAISIVAMVVANSAASTINTVLNTSNVSVTGVDTTDPDNIYFASSYDSVDELVSDEYAFIEDVQEEGSVLLRNNNSTLPLDTATQGKVTCFGRASADIVYAGTGTGAVNTEIAPTLLDSLTDAGFSVNETLYNFYASFTDYDLTNTDVGEVPVSEYTDDVINSFSSYSDAAIVVISRIGGEDGDLSAENQYLELCDEERDMLELVNQYFDTIIVLINSSNAVALGWLDEYNVDACLWIGGVGTTGLNAVADILAGTRNPSGKLSDTYAANSFSSPAMQNFPSYAYTNSEEIEAAVAEATGEADVLGSTHTYYVVEAEGIYIGYRYYETRYEDCVLGQGNADSGAGTYESESGWSYSDEVCYSFGYGLSYTTFRQTLDSITVDEDSITVKATVTNTGSVAGKDVVEVYFQSPYTDYDKEYGVEKASVELGGFAKTDELQPGDSQTLTVVIDKEDMTSYDANGVGSYILEAGDYYLAIGNGAHDALNNILAAKGYTTANGMDYDGTASNAYLWENTEADSGLYSVSSVTGNAITNQFEEADLNYYIDGAVTYLTRQDWNTFPTTYDSVTATEEMIEALGDTYEVQNSDISGITVDADNGLTLIDMQGLDYDDPQWEKLVDQLSLEEISDIIGIGGYQTEMAISVSFNGAQDTDGPVAINSILLSSMGGTCYTGTDITCTGYNTEPVLASTWNVEIARQYGEFLGEDGLWSGYNGIYGPGMNTHRTPYSGRNFEYYSEDSNLSYIIGAAEVQGATSKGLKCFVKHFVMNDQETHRHGISTFNTEQAIREIYLHAFEGAIVEGGTLSIMSSFNRIGCTWAAAHEGVMTEVLRNEWGFNGHVVTDAAMMTGYCFMDYRSALAAGNDMWLSPSMAEDSARLLDYISNDADLLTAAKESCHRILYANLNSSAINGYSSEMEINVVQTWWQITLTALVVVTGILTAAFTALAALSVVSSKKGANEA